MARKDRRTPPGGRLRALLEAGDHRGARVEARARLADPSASDADRAEAAAVLASLAPDRAVVGAAAVGVALALALAAFALLAG